MRSAQTGSGRRSDRDWTTPVSSAPRSRRLKKHVGGCLIDFRLLSREQKRNRRDPNGSEEDHLVASTQDRNVVAERRVVQLTEGSRAKSDSSWLTILAVTLTERAQLLDMVGDVVVASRC